MSFIIYIFLRQKSRCYTKLAPSSLILNILGHHIFPIITRCMWEWNERLYILIWRLGLWMLIWFWTCVRWLGFQVSLGPIPSNDFLIKKRDKICGKNISIDIVGSRFVTQAQKSWVMSPMSPLQKICREWVKELGF